MSVDEMEEAMSIAPKKEKGGHVAIGPWRPDWHKKASAEDAAQTLKADNPQGRFIQTDEVAGSALWLCSDAARSVNGHALTLSGGEI